MGDVRRFVSDGSGEVHQVDHDVLRAKMEEKQTEPVASQHRRGNVRTRYDAATDTMTVLSDGQPKSIEPSSTDPLDHGESPNGRVLRSQLTEASILRHPRFGGSINVREGLALGWITKTPAGYVLSGEMADLSGAATSPTASTLPTAPQAKPQSPEQKSEPVVNPNDGKNLPPTSAGVDSVLASVAKEAPQSMDHLITSLAHGGNVQKTIAEISARLEGDPDENSAKIAGALAEHEAVAAQAARNVGLPAGLESALVTWAQKTDPDGLATAYRELVENKSVGAVQALARSFVAQRNESIARIANAKGFDAKVEEGRVMFLRSAFGLAPTPKRGDFGGSLWMTEAEAKQVGLEINEK